MAGGFQGKRQRAAEFGEENRFRPALWEIRFGGMVDPAGAAGRVAVDFRSGFRWKPRADGCDDGVRAIRDVLAEVDFIQIEIFGFPVFMQGNEQVGRGIGFQPCRMGRHLRGIAPPIVAVHVMALRRLAAAARQAGRIERRANGPCDSRGEKPLDHQIQQSQRTGRFVAMDSGG